MRPASQMPQSSRWILGLLLALCPQLYHVTAGNAIVVFPHIIPPPNSHMFALNRLVKELAERGHRVTVSRQIICYKSGLVEQSYQW